MKYWAALNFALREEMVNDARVCVIGEDIGVAGGPFGVTRGLLEEFGPARVRNAPIAEAGIVGVGIGAAVAGLRPVVEIMFMDFMTLCADQVVNQAAKTSFFSAGTITVPLTIRTVCGTGGGMGAQHSQSLESWFCHVPGLTVVAPSTPADAMDLLTSSIRLDEPVIFIEHAALYRKKGSIRPDRVPAVIGRATTVRPGTDLTVVAYGRTVGVALEAADILATRGRDPEVIDLRTLQPWDRDHVLSSVDRTGRLLVVHDAWEEFGFGSEIVATVCEAGPRLLSLPRRLGAARRPASVLTEAEATRLPHAASVAAVAQVLYAPRAASELAL